MPKSKEELKALIFEIAAGEVASLERLYFEVGSRLVAKAVYILGNVDDAADAVQDTFVTVAKKAYTYRGGDAIGWLNKLLKNVCINKLRDHKKQQKIAAVQETAGGGNIDHIDKKMDISKAFESLSQIETEVIVEIYFADKTVKEASFDMNIKPATLYKIRERALQKMKKSLGE